MPHTNSLDLSTPASADKALTKISTLMGRAGQPVVAHEFNPKAKRSSDTTYREAYLTLASGQQVTLRVNSTGDIYQVLLNSSVQPLKEHTDTEKAVVEIAGLAEKNQAKFQKAQARKAVALPKGMSTPKPKIADALAQQVAGLDTQITERKATLADLQAKLKTSGMLDSAKAPEMDDATKDVLRQLGKADGQALDDGDVCSKNGRDTLAELGLIDRYTAAGANVLNDKGRAAFAMLDSASASHMAGDDCMLVLGSAYVAAHELRAATGLMLDDATTEGAKATLQVALDVVENNCPISLEEGNVAQARHQMQMAHSFKAAIAMLDDARQRPLDDKALEQLVAIAKADAVSEDEIADQSALAALLAHSLVEVAEGIYFLTEAGRQHLNANGMDAYGEPFAE